jgi:hypothetical protein
MGLLKHLLFWPVTAPKALVDFSLAQIQGLAREELTDDQRIREDLMVLQMELEVGSIDDAEYMAREAEIMERLRDARAWRTRFGMEEEWAPLEFAPEPGVGDEPPAEPADPVE